MKEFEEYFSFEAIVRDLVKWRIAGKDVGGTLPPRKTWSRAGVKERRGVDPASIRKQSILRTIFRCRESPLPPHLYKSGGSRGRVRPAGKLEDTIWGRKLLALVEEVQTAVFGGSVVFEEPKKFEIAKGRENGVTKFRTVASFERLSCATRRSSGLRADLSEPEALGANSWFPFFVGLNILPILMAATMALQSAVTPSTGDKQQQRMMMIMMPLMMLVMFYSFPSALSLYWTVSQVLSIAQMWWIRKRYTPAPVAASEAVVDIPVTRQMRRHGGSN